MGIYSPKIKISTMRDMARRMISTQSGKNISHQALNKFLKGHKELHKVAFGPGHSAVEKYKAVKFFGKLANKITQSDKFKISYFAKKIGIKPGTEGNLGKVTLNRIYQKAAYDEQAVSQKPEGPTPEELEKQKRRQEAFRTLRKRERADEMKKEQEGLEKKEPSQRSLKAVPIAQGRPGVTPALASVSDEKTTAVGAKTSVSETRVLPSLAILPISNPQRIQSANWLAKKINNLLIRVIKSLNRFKVTDQLSIDGWLRNIGWEEGEVISLEQARNIGRTNKVDFVIMGEWQKEGVNILVVIQLIDIKKNTVTKIAKIREKEENLFELENKLIWQIHNFFEGKELEAKKEVEKEQDVPSAEEAEDLPI